MECIAVSFFFLLYSKLLGCVSGQLTALAKNNGQFASSLFTDIQEVSYPEFAAQSKTFIDKTLLINELIFKRHASSVIACPRKWGKTMSLKMINSFLQMELDLRGQTIPREETLSYQLFRRGKIFYNNTQLVDLENPLLISKLDDDLLDRYQGGAPVIYVDFHSIHGNNHIEFVNNFKYQISQVFKAHTYLTESFISLNQSYIEKFNFFRRQTNVKAIDLINSLVFLSEFLYRFFNKRVYILIDSYDWPITSALLHPKYPRKDQSVIFFRNFLKATLNANEYLEMAVLTGTFTISELNFLKEVNITNEYSVKSANHNIIEFYGFNQTHVDSLLDHNLIPAKGREQAQQWYNGYHLVNSSYQVYNPYSIMQFAATRTVGTYWVHNDTTDTLLKNALYNPLLEKAFVIILSGNKYYIQLPKLRLKLYDFDCLTKSHGYDAFNMAIRLLIAAGYITPITRRRNEVLLKIPNQEAHYTLTKMAKVHFESRFNSSRPIRYETFMEPAAEELQVSMENENCTLVGLIVQLEDFLKHLPPFCDDPTADTYKRELTYGDDHVILSLFYFIILSGKNFHFLDLKNHAFLDVNYILLLVPRKKRGVVIEVKFDKSIDGSHSSNFELYKSIFQKSKRCKDMKIIEVEVTKDKEVFIASEIVSLTRNSSTFNNTL